MKTWLCKLIGISSFLLISACTMGDCSDETSTYPTSIEGGEVIENAIHARITQNGLDFIRNKLAVFLSSTYFELDEDGYISYSIASEDLSSGSAIQIASAEVYSSKIRIFLDTLIENMDMGWLDNDDQGRPGMRISIQDIELLFDVAIDSNNDTLAPAACLVTSGTSNTPIQVQNISFDVRYAIDLSGAHPSLLSSVENVQIDLATNVENAAQDLSIQPCNGTDSSCDNPICQQSEADCEEICALIDLFTQLGGFVDSLLAPLLDQMAPTIGEELAESIGDIASQVPVGIESQVGFDDFLVGGIDTESPLHMKVSPRAEVTVEGSGGGKGLQLVFDAGFTTEAIPSCGGALSAPDFGTITAPEVNYSGFLEFLNQEDENIFAPYHMAISVGQPFFNQVAFAIYKSGIFCLRLSPETVNRFVGDVIDLESQLLMGLDSRLSQIGPSDAPLIIQLQAQSVPQIELGSGRTLAENYYEPLIKTRINNLGVNVYMVVDDAHRRIVETSLNLEIDLGVEQDEQQTLQIVLENFTLSSIEQTYNEVLPDADFSELIEVIVQIMIDQITTEQLSFDFDVDEIISEEISVPIKLKINSLRRDFGEANDYLSIYATLCDNEEQADETNLLCSNSSSTSSGNNEDFAIKLSDTSKPSNSIRGKVQAEIHHPNPEAYLFQYRVDGGIWSGFKEVEEGTLAIKNPLLRVEGVHEVEIRTRSKRLPYQSQQQSALLTIDRTAPTFEVRAGEQGLYLEARDHGFPEDIQLWGKLSVKASDWHRVSSFIPYADLSAQKAAFFAQDGAGNKSAILYWSPTPDTILNSSTLEDVKRGCQATGLNPLSLFLCFGSLALIIRRRSRHP